LGEFVIIHCNGWDSKQSASEHLSPGTMDIAKIGLCSRSSAIAEQPGRTFQYLKYAILPPVATDHFTSQMVKIQQLTHLVRVSGVTRT